MNILLTGGSGLLGRHLKIKADRPTHTELDVTGAFLARQYDLIVHCAAFTDVQKAETDQRGCFNTNVLGTFNLLANFPDTPIVYISSEYAHNPLNFYSFTKNLGEQLCLQRGKCLVIRTLFKDTPWPFDKAFTDQFTEGDYVDVIAPLIDKAIASWSGTSKQVIYVGTGRKTMFELAQRTRPEVLPNLTTDMKVPIQKDYK